MSNSFRYSCPNCIVNVYRIILSEISILKHLPLFFIFGHWEEEYASIVLKVQQGCQNCVLRSIGIVWGKSALSPENCFFEHFLAWNKSFGLIAENFWQCCQIFILTVHKINFRKKMLYFFSLFRTLSEKNSTFHRRLCGRVVKTCGLGFHMIIPNLCLSTIFFFLFWSFSENLCARCRKFLGMVFKIASYLSEKLVWIKNYLFFKKTKVFECSVTLSEKLTFSCQAVFSSGLSKLQSKRLYDFFLKNFFFYQPLMLRDKKSLF